MPIQLREQFHFLELKTSGFRWSFGSLNYNLAQFDVLAGEIQVKNEKWAKLEATTAGICYLSIICITF